MHDKYLVEIDYTNHQGMRTMRRILPHEFRFEASEWHPEQQWVLVAFDTEKNQFRHFAMKDIHSWRPLVFET